MEMCTIAGVRVESQDIHPAKRLVMTRLTGAVLLLLAVGAMAPTSRAADDAGPLRVGVFRVDATPPLGTPVAYALARKIEDPLTARGVVLLGAGKPIVLCAVDWISIANGGHDKWRESLARAVGTSNDRVAVHVLHQHDGVRCDFSAEELLALEGLAGKRFDVPFVRKTIENAAAAAQASLQTAQRVTHLGVGEAKSRRWPRIAAFWGRTAAWRLLDPAHIAFPSRSYRA
jgi:hypothetical protein